MIFPFEIDKELGEEGEKIASDYEIDFETGKLTGRIIEGLQATVQWARLVLSTERYFFTQYSWNYGSELSELIGKGYKKDYIESEVNRIVNEALMVNEDITGIDELEIKFVNDKLKISFKLNTIYGRGKVNV